MTVSHRVGHSSQFDDRLHRGAPSGSGADTGTSVLSIPLPALLWGRTGGRGTAGVGRTLLPRHPQTPGTNGETEKEKADFE